MSKVTTYNPKKVTCALGNHIASGYADDSFISIEPSSVYTVKLALLQASSTNAYLQKMYDMDKKDGNGTFNVNITDLIGNEKFTGSVAWVTKPAAWERGKSQGNREWEIAVGEGQVK